LTFPPQLQTNVTQTHAEYLNKISSPEFKSQSLWTRIQTYFRHDIVDVSTSIANKRDKIRVSIDRWDAKHNYWL